MSELIVDFAGEEHRLTPGTVFTAGRAGDLVLDDDNLHLHRQLIELRHQHGFWWISNVGSTLGLTVCGEVGSLEIWLAPGHRVPVVLPLTEILCSAGATNYGIELRLEGAAYQTTIVEPDPDGTLTLRGAPLSPGQIHALTALAEPTLRRSGPGVSPIPTSTVAGDRIGITAKAFEKRIEEICRKLEKAGVRGVHGSDGTLATHRRARLVEYAVAARLVTPAQLALLPQVRADNLAKSTAAAQGGGAAR